MDSFLDRDTLIDDPWPLGSPSGRCHSILPPGSLHLPNWPYSRRSSFHHFHTPCIESTFHGTAYAALYDRASDIHDVAGALVFIVRSIFAAL